MTITIRLATPADQSTITRLHNEVSRDAYAGIVPENYLNEIMYGEREALWTMRFATPEELAKLLIMIAESDGLPIGFICFKLDPDDTQGAYLNHLFVTSSFQGQGVARRLIAEAVQALPVPFATGAIYLRAFAENHKALAFYDRLGGEIVERTVSPNSAQGNAPVVRYVWPNASALQRAVSD